MRSADPEEARIVGTRVYYPHRVVVQGDSARFAMRLSAASLGPLTVGWLGYETQVRIETEELGQYQVNVPTADTMRSECGNRDIISSPRTAAVYRPDQPTAFEGWSTPAPMLALKIARHSLERQLEQLLDRPLRGPIDFRLDMDISGGRGAQWWAMVCSLAADIDDPQSLIRQPLIAAPFAYSIMSGLLMAGTHSHLEELTAPAMAVSAETVRRARQFIEDHAGEPLTVADIARGADVGVRGLQHGFHRSLGTTPMQYLRHVRLRHAHQDLRNADPSSTTVAQVAARWGFLNQGRFAAQYRELYGVQPAETLRKRRLLGAVAGSARPSLLSMAKQLQLVVRARLDEILKDASITALQYTALTVLDHHDGLSSAQLARDSFVTPSRPSASPGTRSAGSSSATPLRSPPWKSA